MLPQITHWRKPSPGSALIKGHPHAQHLMFCVPLLDIGSGFGAYGSEDAGDTRTVVDVGPHQLVGTLVPGSAGIRPVAYTQGFALRGHLAHSEWVSFGPSGDSSWLPTQEATFVIGYDRNDTSLNNFPGAFGVSGSTEANNCGAHIAMFDGNTYWDFGGNTSGTNRLIAPTPSGFRPDSLHLWAFTTGPRGMEVWLDGVLLASNGVNPTRTAGAVNFGLFNHRNQFADNAEIYFFYGYDRQLSTIALSSFMADPYAMFRRPLRTSTSRYALTESISAPAASPSWTVPAPTIVLGASVLTPAPVASTWTVPTATVVPGAVTLAAGIGTPAWTVPAHTFSRHELVHITQHRITAVRTDTPRSRITQHRITVIRRVVPTPPDPPVPTDDPCGITEPVYWAVIKPSGDEGDVYQGAIASLCDPEGYYGDYKQPNIINIGTVTRASSDFLTGSLPAQSTSVVWADTNHFVRDVFATTRSDWNNSEMWVYLIDNPTRLALGTPRLLFYGIIKGDTPSVDLTYTTPAYDVIGATYSITGDDIQVPKRTINRNDFPGCPPESIDLGVPIIYGSHIKDQGAVKVIDVGDFTCQDDVIRRCLLISGHACRTVIPYQGGDVAIPDADYGVNVWAPGHPNWTDIVPGGEVYVEINDQWFTLMFVTGGRAAAYDSDSDALFRGTVTSGASKTVFTLTSGEGAQFVADDKIAVMRAKNSNQPEIKIIDSVVGDVITLVEGVGDTPVAGDTVRSAFVPDTNQTPFVYVNVDGQEVDGDGHGAIIEDLLPQDLHAIENWYYGNYMKGDWADTYTFKFYPGGDDVQLFDRQSWFDAHAVSESYLSGGFKGAFIIGAQGRRKSMRSVMADTAVSGNFMRSTRNNNQLFVFMLDRDRTRFISGRTTITDVINILDQPKFAPQAMRDWLCNDLVYRYSPNYRDDNRGGWDSSGEHANAPSIILNGTVVRREVYNMVADQDTADTVAQQRLDFMAYTPMMWSWGESLCGLNRQVSNGVGVDHFNGTGESGFLGQGLWILKQVCDPMACKVTFSAVDVEHLLSDSYELIVVGGSGSGHYTAGTTVVITADPPDSGFVFDQWTGDPVTSATSSSTTVVMPTGNVTVTATYEDVSGALYTLTVINGSGSGNYAAGDIVPISANAPATGYDFNVWTGDPVDDDTNSSTFIVMPSSSAIVTATYVAEPESMFLDVESGTGDGTYDIGDTVAIAADAAPMGMSFVEWIGEPSVVAEIDDVNDPTTNINIIDLPASIRIAWDANLEIEGVVGYRVLYGTTSGVYPNSVDVGDVTTYLLSDLESGTTYYIVLTAYSSGGVYSGYSSEISFVACNMKVTATYA